MNANMAHLLRLPYGEADFETLRREKRIYVDKTDLIYRLARFGIPFFMARPAGFGKTLLLSSFASLFSHGLEYFKGLKIEKFGSVAEMQ